MVCSRFRLLIISVPENSIPNEAWKNTNFQCVIFMINRYQITKYKSIMSKSMKSKNTTKTSQTPYICEIRTSNRCNCRFYFLKKCFTNFDQKREKKRLPPHWNECGIENCCFCCWRMCNDNEHGIELEARTTGSAIVANRNEKKMKKKVKKIDRRQLFVK